ncbi:MAG: flagellar basal body P-ring formation chaperone FlgA [Deltaproteobacteria bacterium]|nr:flagellar basal body P-ring formation chaperone FlgA [Deltaproteobacteria bacterium]
MKKPSHHQHHHSHHPSPRIGLALFILALTWVAPLFAHGEPVSQDPAAPEMVEIHLSERAEVTRDQYTLGEVATLSGADESTLEALRSVPMGRSPQPGKTAQLNGATVINRLRGSLLPERIRLDRAAQVTIVRRANRVSGDVIARQVLAKAAQETAAETGVVNVEDLTQEVVTVLAPLDLPEGDLEWRVERQGRGEPGGDRSYLVEAVVAGRVEWRQPVRVRQQIHQTVAVAARPVRLGDILQPADITQKRVVVRALPAGARYITNLTEAVGQKALAPLAEGTPLQTTMVEKPMTVKEGSKVTLVYETPNLLLSVPGVALSNGGPGDFIPARNLESGKVVYGVVSPGERLKVN